LIDACQDLEPLADLKASGAFVTLKIANTLRGCCEYCVVAVNVVAEKGINAIEFN